MNKVKFVLASKSPRRCELLKNIGVDFDVIVSDADESVVPKDLPPGLYVQELALLKGTSVSAVCSKNQYVIAADTVVVFDGEIIGKPKDSEDATRMLSKFSDATHQVYTGFSVTEVKSGKTVSGYEKTEVHFRNLSQEEINEYVSNENPYDKAGGYGIQGRAGIFVDRIDGDFFNVVGLPLCGLNELMKKEFNISL